MSSNRKFFVGGNWKMNGDFVSIDNIISFLIKGPLSAETQVVIAPPTPYLHYVRQKLPPSIHVSAQNCYKAQKGAFTGEVSPLFLKDLAIEWAILGHSERRHVLGETIDFVVEKAICAINSGIKVIFCIGEKLDEREAGKTNEINLAQLSPLFAAGIDWNSVVIAYEPVWAIGTGKTATPEQAQDAHEWIRKLVAERVSTEVANQLRIIYGGSVTAENCVELAKKKDIDGFLVGGASLKPDFVKIVNATEI